MSQLLAFTNYVKDRQYAIEDLGRFSELVEPIEDETGRRGYRLKPLRPADRITQKCKVLVEYTWHCRDYVKKLLSETGVARNVGQIVNEYIAQSSEIQVISYLANEYKHAGVDKSQRWAVDIEPRWGKPFVLGQLLSFPHTLKPTFQVWGDSLPEFEFTGLAGVGDEIYTFKDFVWTFSCTVLDKDGKALGHAAALCERAFAIWWQILGDYVLTATTDAVPG